MAIRYLRKLAVLAKIETGYGADANPIGTTDAMQMTNVVVDPMAGGQVSRELLLPYLGHQGIMLTGTHMTLAGDIELAGSGDPGTPPAYGPALRMCGWAQTIMVDTDVAYNVISGAFEAGTIYYNLDGVRHIGLGARGTWSLNLQPSQIPRFRFALTALSGTITDTPLPTVDLTKFIKPVVVSKTNTSMSLHGWNAAPGSAAESLAIELANQVEPRFLIGDENIQITDRQATGTAVLEATSLATKNWFAIAKAETRDVLHVQHGTVAGNIVEIDGAAVQIGRVTQGSTQGIANYSLPLMFTPDEGNDELVLTVR